MTSTASTGAAAELSACAYLLTRGFHVFRSVSPACPVDAVAFRPGEMPIKVEIKALSRNKGCCAFAWPTNHEWDLLLVVGPEGHIFEIMSGTPRNEAINTIRAFYGLPPVGTTSGGGFPPAPQEHGTPRGYGQHMRRGTEVCPECRRAARDEGRVKAQATRQRVREEWPERYPLTGG